MIRHLKTFAEGVLAGLVLASPVLLQLAGCIKG